MQKVNMQRLNKQIVKIGNCLMQCLVILALALPLIPYTETCAEETDTEHKTKKVHAMNQKVYEKLTQAQELIEQKDYKQGLSILDEVKARDNLTAYEIAHLWNYYAYTYYLQEKYKESITAYEKVLKQPDLPDGLITSTLNTLSQLYFSIENYQAALDTANKLVQTVAEPSTSTYLLIGQAHYQLEQYEEAIKPINKAIQIHHANGKQPKENWLLLLRVIYFELGQYEKMINVLNEMIRLYPKEQYLRTLAGAYSELNQIKKQLAITEALYDMGYLQKESEKLNLANMFLLHEVPYKAARLIQDLIDRKAIESNENNLRLLSQAWYQAMVDEKAIPPLKLAAAKAQSGELYIRLAQSYINLESWQNATAALTKGIAKGNLKRPDTAYVMLGMARFNQNQLDLSKNAFQKASEDKRSRKTAEQWLAYVENELHRADVMQSIAN